MTLREMHGPVVVLRAAPRDGGIHVILGAAADEHAQDLMDVRDHDADAGTAEIRLGQTGAWQRVALATTHEDDLAAAYVAAREALQQG